MFAQSLQSATGPLPALIRRLPDPPLPLAPLSAAFTLLLRSALRRHPGVVARMGAAANASFLLDATDAPTMVLMQPAAGRLAAVSRRNPARLPRHDASIRGSLGAFLAMLHGSVDGDALFFAGDLSISGDTGAVLALRNALDDAEIDLAGELAALTGRAAPLTRWLLHGVAARTGLLLSRPESKQW